VTLYNLEHIVSYYCIFWGIYCRPCSIAGRGDKRKMSHLFWIINKHSGAVFFLRDNPAIPQEMWQWPYLELCHPADPRQTRRPFDSGVANPSSEWSACCLSLVVDLDNGPIVALGGKVSARNNFFKKHTLIWFDLHH
jgi:hypothetical protein